MRGGVETMCAVGAGPAGEDAPLDEVLYVNAPGISPAVAFCSVENFADMLGVIGVEVIGTSAELLAEKEGCYSDQQHSGTSKPERKLDVEQA